MKNNAMIALLEQGQRVQPEPFAEGRVRRRLALRRAAQEPSEGCDAEPERRRREAGEGRRVRTQRADQPAAGHPPQGAESADGSELARRVAQTVKHDRAGDAPGGRQAEGLQLDQEEDDPGGAADLDGSGRQRHRRSGANRKPAEHSRWSHLSIGHRAEEQRRHKSRRG